MAMNREQRRNLQKAIKSGKVDVDKVKNALSDLIELQASTYGIEQGDKVKLNYDKIVSDPNFENMNPDFKTWVNQNKDTILTVEFEERQERNKMFCTFLEDDSGLKWWVFVGDLIKVGNENE